MQCYICHRHSSTGLAFNCALCSRDVLQQPRIRLAQSLLERESLGKEVEHRISTDAPLSAKTTRGPKSEFDNSKSAWNVQRTASDQTISEAKTEVIVSYVEALRKEIRSIKGEIMTRKAKLLGRRSRFDSAKLETAQNEQTAEEAAEKSIRRTRHRWEIVHDKIIESRGFLCKEAALLYGLQQHKRRKGAPGREVFSIAGLPIADLRDLNSIPHSVP